MATRRKRSAAQKKQGNERAPQGEADESEGNVVNKRRKLQRGKLSSSPTSGNPKSVTGYEETTRLQPTSPTLASNIEKGSSEIQKGIGVQRVRTPPRRPTRLEEDVTARPISGCNQLAGHFFRRREFVDPLFKVRTAASIPQNTESDDHDVLQIRRQPFQENELYKQFVEDDSEDGDGQKENPSRLVSTITPVVQSQGLLSEELRRGGNEEEHGSAPEMCGQNREEVPGTESIRNNHHQGIKMLHAQKNMLKSLYKDIEEKITSEVSSLRHYLTSKIEGLETESKRVFGVLKELQVVVSSGKGGSNCHSRLTPLAKYEAKLDSLTPNGDWVFNTETICKVFRVNLAHFVVKMSEKQGDTLGNLSEAVRTILFGLQPSQRRAVYSSGVGRTHSAFRFTIVMNALYNVQQNSFGRFTQIASPNQNGSSRAYEKSDSGDSLVRSQGSSSNQIVQPEWLEAGFITQFHVEEARSRLETNIGTLDQNEQNNNSGSRQRKTWINVKEVPDKMDIAKYGALKIYRYITTGLYQAREKARWVLFEELTYLMTNWKCSDVDVNQQSLFLQWEHTENDVQGIDISDVPKSIRQKDDLVHADEQNNRIYAEFLSTRKEAVLCVSHEVKVRTVGSSSRQRRSEVQILNRYINLIDVATKFCVIFTEQAVGEFSPGSFLGAHESSLRCIYGVAILLKKLVDVFMDEYLGNGKIPFEDGEKPLSIESHGVSLENLVPAASVRKRLLSSRCLRMTDFEFEKINLREETGAELDAFNDQTLSTVNNNPIDIDGVMLI